MKSKSMKRLLCMLLCVAMMLTMLPMPVHAYVGAMNYNPGGVTAGVETVDGKKINYLKNDYIGFYISPDGNLHTYPSQKSINNINFSDYTEKNIFFLQYKGVESWDLDFTSILDQTQKDVRIDNSDPNNPRLIQTLQIGTKNYGYFIVEICYKIVKLDRGAHDIYHERTAIIYKDYNDDGTTWGIEGRATLLETTGSFVNNEYVLNWTTIHKNFGTVGHSVKPNIRVNRHIIESYTSDDRPNQLYYSSPLFPQDGFKFMNAEDVNEVYTDSFTYANQFVALNGYVDATGWAWNEEEQKWVGELYVGIEGHFADKYNDLNDYGKYLRYDGYYLYVAHDIVEADGYNARALWGFRDLFSNTTGQNPPPDPVIITGNATYLGIIEDGNKLVTKPGNSE
ncbi:hypothetical protein [Lutispora thermophila]|uniref:Uncharacterized protein n=1 Tax=Lutispora thermophila DSM 19022 TaxID=1122184 RepID=A0A1M6D0Z7_9FIRM|nr:hypothetical protein [Lutispora thermophila]SHI66985.1 hypothetical protein SAMN02745176_00962 [Lutispora thermophila DSM 19022]